MQPNGDETLQSEDAPMERIIVTESMIARFWEIFTRVTQPSAKTFDAIQTALQVVFDDYTNGRRAEQAYRLTDEVNALIDEALTFGHQDCGTVDSNGYGCIRCKAENADMRRKSNASMEAALNGKG